MFVNHRHAPTESVQRCLVSLLKLESVEFASPLSSTFSPMRKTVDSKATSVLLLTPMEVQDSARVVYVRLNASVDSASTTTPVNVKTFRAI